MSARRGERVDQALQRFGVFAQAHPVFKGGDGLRGILGLVDPQRRDRRQLLDLGGDVASGLEPAPIQGLESREALFGFEQSTRAFERLVVQGLDAERLVVVVQRLGVLAERCLGVAHAMVEFRPLGLLSEQQERLLVVLHGLSVPSLGGRSAALLPRLLDRRSSRPRRDRRAHAGGGGVTAAAGGRTGLGAADDHALLDEHRKVASPGEEAGGGDGVETVPVVLHLSIHGVGADPATARQLGTRSVERRQERLGEERRARFTFGVGLRADHESDAALPRLDGRARRVDQRRRERRIVEVGRVPGVNDQNHLIGVGRQGGTQIDQRQARVAGEREGRSVVVEDELGRHEDEGGPRWATLAQERLDSLAESAASLQHLDSIGGVRFGEPLDQSVREGRHPTGRRLGFGYGGNDDDGEAHAGVATNIAGLPPGRMKNGA